MKTMTSVAAQNQFGVLMDTAQSEAVAVTRHGQTVAYVVAPKLIEDLLDGLAAQSAEKTGFLSLDESRAILERYRHA